MRTFPILYNLTQRKLEKQVIDDLLNSEVIIHKELYKAYAGNLHKGIGEVLNEDKYIDLLGQLKENISRFSAYKAYRATRQIEDCRKDENGKVRSEEEYRKQAKVVFNAFDRYQVAEYNTAVARSRTAKQWTDFNGDAVNRELYPNLKWLPSRSADPREEHRKFYGLVLPKSHPFWNTNQPGNLWNCKCDWEETDEQAFTGNVPEGKPDPGITGEVFTEKAAYFQVSNRERDIIEKALLEFLQQEKN